MSAGLGSDPARQGKHGRTIVGTPKYYSDQNTLTAVLLSSYLCSLHPAKCMPRRGGGFLFVTPWLV